MTQAETGIPTVRSTLAAEHGVGHGGRARFVSQPGGPKPQRLVGPAVGGKVAAMAIEVRSGDLLAPNVERLEEVGRCWLAAAVGQGVRSVHQQPAFNNGGWFG